MSLSKIDERLGYDLNEKVINMFHSLLLIILINSILVSTSIFIQSYIDRLIELMQQRIHVPFNEDTIYNKIYIIIFSKAYLRITQNIYLNNPLVIR